jgi:hypothetical protein
MEDIKTTIFVSVSVSLHPKIRLFHDQSPPCTSFDSRIFENVTARHGTCEGSEERKDCVKRAQKEGLLIRNRQAGRIKEEKNRSYLM